MNYAIDRAHFRKRIQQTEMIWLPILHEKKVIKGHLEDRVLMMT